MVEDVEVLDAELEVGFALDGEGADDGGIPVGVAGAAEGVLDDVAEAGAGAVLDGDGEGGGVEPVDAGLACRSSCPRLHSDWSRRPW